MTRRPALPAAEPMAARRMAAAARRLPRAGAAVVVLAAAALGGCASLNVLDSDVSSYSQWPEQRQPSTYVFERLPSQQAHGARQADLEAAARNALALAGFKEVGAADQADVTVQLGARLTRVESPWAYADPFPFYGPMWYGYRGWPAWGYGWGPGYYRDPPTYEREVALLIRDRKSGQALYETRASTEGYTAGGTAFLAAMFEAALKDFPKPAVNPRRVSVPLAGQKATS